MTGEITEQMIDDLIKTSIEEDNLFHAIMTIIYKNDNQAKNDREIFAELNYWSGVYGKPMVSRVAFERTMYAIERKGYIEKV